VLVRVRFERLLPLHRQIDFARRHGAFLDNAVRNHYRSPAMKEVKHPIVNSLITGAKLINLIPEIIRLRALQFVPQLFEPLKTVRRFCWALAGMSSSLLDVLIIGNGCQKRLVGHVRAGAGQASPVQTAGWTCGAADAALAALRAGIGTHQEPIPSSATIPANP
jgi:hypothetical protein